MVEWLQHIHLADEITGYTLISSDLISDQTQEKKRIEPLFIVQR